MALHLPDPHSLAGNRQQENFESLIRLDMFPPRDMMTGDDEEATRIPLCPLDRTGTWIPDFTGHQ